MKKMQSAEREVFVMSNISQVKLGIKGGMVCNKWGRVKVKSPPNRGEKAKCRGLKLKSSKLGTNYPKMTDFF